MSAHFERVHERYRSGHTGGGGDGWESIPDGDLQQNELTAQFRR